MIKRTSLINLTLILMLVFSIVSVGCGDDDDDDDDSSDDDEVSDDDDGSDDDDNDNANDDDDDDATGEMTASLEVNPICDISCIVNWETSEPGTSWVEFGLDSESYSMRIGSDDEVASHEVIVVGMHAEQTYKLRAVTETTTKGKLVSQDLSFTAGSLPQHWMVGDLDVYEEDKVNDGWTITHLSSGAMTSKMTVIIYDMTGQPVWFYAPNDTLRMDSEVQMIDNKYVLAGPGVAGGENVFQIDLAGNVVWEGPTQPSWNMMQPGALHHVFHQTPDGQYITAENVQDGSVISDRIIQVDSDNNTTWSWSFFDQTYLPYDPSVGSMWTHVNSVSMDPANNHAYINAYYLSMVFKVDTTTDEVLWMFGENGDFAADPDATPPWFSSAHGLDYLGDNKIVLYDNGGIFRGYSRAVIYQLDDINMTSELIWEYRGEDQSDQWYNMTIGDADVLDNGNVLITAGNGAQNQSPTRLIEVTPSGEKVWQLWMYNEADKKIVCFESDRINTLAEPL